MSAAAVCQIALSTAIVSVYRLHGSYRRCDELVSVCRSFAGAALGRGVGKMAAHVISFQSLHVLQPPEQTGAGSLPT